MVTVQLNALKLGIADAKGLKSTSEVTDVMVLNRLHDIADFRLMIIGLIDGRRPLYKVKPGRIIEEFMVPPLMVSMTDRLASKIIDEHHAGSAAFAARYILNGPINVQEVQR